MKPDQDPRELVARLITEAEDPRAELLDFARSVSAYQRRRRWAALAAACVVVVGVTLFAWTQWGGDRSPQNDEPEALTARESHEVYIDAVSAATWLDEISGRPKSSSLSPAEEQTTRQFLKHSSSIVRRDALRTLADRNVLLSESELTWFLANPHPETNAQALRLAWFWCSAHHRWHAVHLLEEYATVSDVNLMKYALRSLGQIKSYVPPESLLPSLRASPPSVQEAAKVLLDRVGRR